MYRPVLIVPPVIAPISLVEAKKQLDIGYTEKDDLISALIDAATSYLDGWSGILGRALCEQTWRQGFDRFDACLRLPMFPVVSVSSVKYTDTNGAEQTVASENYTVQTDDLGTYIEFVYNYASPPLKQFLPAAVRVEYVAGYADTPAVDAIAADPDSDPPVEAAPAVPRLSNVPTAIKQAMLLMIRQWFDNPSSSNVGTPVFAMPFAVDALLAPYRRVKF